MSNPETPIQPYVITEDQNGVRFCNLSLLGGVMDIDLRARDEGKHHYYPVIIYLPSMNIRSGRAHILKHRKVIVLATLTAHLKFLFGDEAAVGDPGIEADLIESAMATMDEAIKNIVDPKFDTKSS